MAFHNKMLEEAYYESSPFLASFHSAELDCLLTLHTETCDFIESVTHFSQSLVT